MALLLLKQIASLFLIIASGFLLVRLKLMKGEDSRPLSVLCIYLIVPCVIIRSFQIELTEEVRNGFLMAVASAVLVHFCLLVISFILGKTTKLTAVERASMVYSNSGNLIIPLVTAIIGQEWVIYASAFLCVQLLFFWTHGQGLISGQAGVQWKKLLTNLNLIAIAIGFILMAMHIQLPGIVFNAVDNLAGLIGPVSMIMIGMLLAEADLKAIAASPRVYLISLVRLIAAPLIILLVMKLIGMAGWMAEGKTILYISFLALVAPSATMVVQLAQLHQNQPEYASAINVMTTLMCIATMPLMTLIYMAFI